jgi:lipopolysaccharide biosynthesis glycosyltransferase|tara:strand:- start:1525 stop:2382 length:858 start_codon:yes stop_codon:yes gene_type:complete
MDTMMKKAIFTLAIGDENPMYRAALLSFEQYAKKVGADLIVSKEFHYPITIKDPQHTASPAWTEKLYIKELLKQYDRVLYVDADIIIQPDAENIFDVYDDVNTVYLFNEGEHLERQNVIDKITSIMGPLDNWPAVNNRPVYYNLGCMLISKQSRLFDIAKLEDLQLLCNHIKYYEQTYVNYLLHRDGLAHQSISPKFNRMDFMGPKNYRDASFIHYAGRGYSNSSLKREVRFVNDFCELFKGHIDDQVLADIKQSGWDLFINKVQQRYKLPKPIINAIAKRFVTI